MTSAEKHSSVDSLKMKIITTPKYISSRIGSPQKPMKKSKIDWIALNLRLANCKIELCGIQNKQILRVNNGP